MTEEEKIALEFANEKEKEKNIALEYANAEESKAGKGVPVTKTGTKIPSGVESLGRGAQAGALMGYTPQVAGGTQAATGQILKGLGSIGIGPYAEVYRQGLQKHIPSAKETYLKAREEQAALEKTMQEENTAPYYIGAGIGGILGTLGGGMAAKSAGVPMLGTQASFPKKVLRRTAQAGLMGAAYNPGETSGEISPIQAEERAKNALIAAGIELPFAALSKPLMQAKQMQKLRAMDKSGQLQQAAYETLKEQERALQKSYISPRAQKIRALQEGKTVPIHPSEIPGGAGTDPGSRSFYEQVGSQVPKAKVPLPTERYYMGEQEQLGIPLEQEAKASFWEPKQAVSVSEPSPQQALIIPGQRRDITATQWSPQESAPFVEPQQQLSFELPSTRQEEMIGPRSMKVSQPSGEMVAPKTLAAERPEIAAYKQGQLPLEETVGKYETAPQALAKEEPEIQKWAQSNLPLEFVAGKTPIETGLKLGPSYAYQEPLPGLLVEAPASSLKEPALIEANKLQDMKQRWGSLAKYYNRSAFGSEGKARAAEYAAKERWADAKLNEIFATPKDITGYQSERAKLNKEMAKAFETKKMALKGMATKPLAAIKPGERMSDKEAYQRAMQELSGVSSPLEMGRNVESLKTREYRPDWWKVSNWPDTASTALGNLATGATGAYGSIPNKTLTLQQIFREMKKQSGTETNEE